MYAIVQIVFAFILKWENSFQYLFHIETKSSFTLGHFCRFKELKQTLFSYYGLDKEKVELQYSNFAILYFSLLLNLSLGQKFFEEIHLLLLWISLKFESNSFRQCFILTFVDKWIGCCLVIGSLFSFFKSVKVIKIFENR